MVLHILLRFTTLRASYAIHLSTWKANMREKKERRLSAPANIHEELVARAALAVLLLGL